MSEPQCGETARTQLGPGSAQLGAGSPEGAIGPSPVSPKQAPGRELTLVGPTPFGYFRASCLCGWCGTAWATDRGAEREFNGHRCRKAAIDWTCVVCGHDSPHVQQDGECWCGCGEYLVGVVPDETCKGCAHSAHDQRDGEMCWCGCVYPPITAATSLTSEGSANG